MNTVKVKTAELEGAALDWSVAKVEGFDVAITKLGFRHDFRVNLRCAKHGLTLGYNYRPSTDWSQGGPLIEKYKLHIHADEPSASFIQSGMRVGYTASTVLIAACRAIVATKLGDEVEIPAELVP